MAKDRINTPDLDFDGGYDDFDFGGGGKTDPSRPVHPFAAGIGSFAGAFGGKTASMIGRSIAREMPSITSNFAEAKNLINDIGQLKQDFSKRINPSIISIRHTSARLLSRVSKFLPPGLQQTIDGLSKKIDAELPKDARTTALEAQEAILQNELTEVFKNQAKLNKAFRQEDRLNTAIDRELGSIRHSSMMKPMVAMANSLSTLTSFHLTTHLAWMRKSLELQYRQLYATQDQLGITENLAKMMDVRLHDITHNTAIPDSEKADIKMQLKQRLRKSRNEMVYGWTRNMVGKIKENVFTKMAEALEDIAGMGEIGADILDTQDEMKAIETDLGDMGDMFSDGPSEDPKVTKAKKHGKTLGGAAGWLAGTKLGAKIVPTLRPFLQDINAWGSNLRGRVGVGLNRRRKEWENEGGIKGFLANFILPNMEPDNKVDSNALGGDESGIAAANYDNASRRSLVEVIPGWLGKIHLVNQQIRDAITGQSDAQEYVYDPTSRDFIKTGELTKKYQKEMFGDAKYRATRIDMAVGQLQAKYAASGDKSDDNVKELSDTVRLIFSNLAVGFESFEPTYFYKWLNPNDNETWNELIDNYIRTAQGGIEPEKFRAAVMWLVKVIFGGGNVPDQHLINQIEYYYFPQITNESFREVMTEVSKGWGHQRFIRPFLKVNGYGTVSIKKSAVAGAMVDTDEDSKKQYQEFGQGAYSRSSQEREDAMNAQRGRYGDRAVDVASGKSTIIGTDTWYGKWMASPLGRMAAGSILGAGHVMGAGAERVLGKERINWIRNHVRSVGRKIHQLSQNPDGTNATNLFVALRNLVSNGIWNKHTEELATELTNELKAQGYDVNAKTGAVEETETTFQSAEDAAEVNEILSAKGSSPDASDSGSRYPKLSKTAKKYMKRDVPDKIEALKVMVSKLPKEKQAVAARKVAGLIRRLNKYNGSPPGGVYDNIAEVAHDLNYELIDNRDVSDAEANPSLMDRFRVGMSTVINKSKDLGSSVKETIESIKDKIASGKLRPLHPQLELHLKEIIELLKKCEMTSDGPKGDADEAEDAEAVDKVTSASDQLDEIINILESTARMNYENHGDLLDILGAIGASVDRIRFIGYGDAKEIVSAAYQSIRAKLKSGKDWIKRKTGKAFGWGWNKLTGIAGWLKDKAFKLGGALLGGGKIGGRNLKGFLGGFSRGLLNTDNTELFDIFRTDNIDPENPLLSARQLRGGVFYKDGSRVEDPRDITEPVYDENENILITEDDIEIGLVNLKGIPIAEVGHTGIGISLGKLSRKAIKGTFRRGGSFLSGVGKLLMGTESTITREIEEQYFDVFLKDQVTPSKPLLSRKQQEDGVWMLGDGNKGGGKLEMTKDIKNPIFSMPEAKEEHPTQLVTKDDITHGLVDINNKPISEHKITITEKTGRGGILGPLGKLLSKTASGGLDLLKNGLMRALGLTGRAGELWLDVAKMTTKGIGKVASNTWDWLRGKSTEGENSPSVMELKRLYELIDTRTKGLDEYIKRGIPKKRSISDSAHEDLDNDGYRDGSYLDQVFSGQADSGDQIGDSDQVGGPNTINDTIRGTIANVVKGDSTKKPGMLRRGASWILNSPIGQLLGAKYGIAGARWLGAKILASPATGLAMKYLVQPALGTLPLLKSAAAGAAGKMLPVLGKTFGSMLPTRAGLGKLNTNSVMNMLVAGQSAYEGFKGWQDANAMQEAGVLDDYVDERKNVGGALGGQVNAMKEAWKNAGFLGKWTPWAAYTIAKASARESGTQLGAAKNVWLDTQNEKYVETSNKEADTFAMAADLDRKRIGMLKELGMASPEEIKKYRKLKTPGAKANYVTNAYKRHFWMKLVDAGASDEQLAEYDKLKKRHEFEQFFNDFNNPKTTSTDTPTENVTAKDWKDGTTLGVTTVDVNVNKAETPTGGRSDGVKASDSDAIITEAWRNDAFNTLPPLEQDKLIAKLRSIASEKGLVAAREALVTLTNIASSKPTPVTQPASEAKSLDIDSWAKPPKYELPEKSTESTPSGTPESAQPTSTSPLKTDSTNEILGKLLSELTKVRELVTNINTQSNNLTTINEGIAGLIDITVQSSNKTTQLLSATPSQPKSPVLAIGRGRN